MTGFGATVNVAKPKKGQTVAIFGLGAVGLAVSFSHPNCKDAFSLHPRLPANGFLAIHKRSNRSTMLQ